MEETSPVARAVLLTHLPPPQIRVRNTLNFCRPAEEGGQSSYVPRTALSICSKTAPRSLAAPRGEGGIPSPLTNKINHACSIDLTAPLPRDEVGVFRSRKSGSLRMVNPCAWWVSVGSAGLPRKWTLDVGRDVPCPYTTGSRQ